MVIAVVAHDLLLGFGSFVDTIISCMIVSLLAGASVTPLFLNFQPQRLRLQRAIYAGADGDSLRLPLNLRQLPLPWTNCLEFRLIVSNLILRVHIAWTLDVLGIIVIIFTCSHSCLHFWYLIQI